MACQGDDYTTRCLVFYLNLNEHYKMITIDLSAQQILDVDPKAIQQINVTGTLERAGNRTLFFFFTEEVKGTILHFRKETMTQHNTLNVKLSNSRLNKSKSGIKNSTQVTLHLSSNAVRESSDETNFIHKLLLTNTQFRKFVKLLQMVHQLI